MRVYLDERQDPPALYVDPGAGPLDVLHEQLAPGTVTSYALPSGAVELLTPDEVVAYVLKLLAPVPLTKTARVAIAKALDVEPEDVGTTLARKRAA